jgi:hypothetical protein
VVPSQEIFTPYFVLTPTLHSGSIPTVKFPLELLKAIIANEFLESFVQRIPKVGDVETHIKFPPQRDEPRCALKLAPSNK